MILGAETIFPPSFYFFPYLLVYPFSQEFDAISPQLPWTVCTFDKGTESSNSVYTYIVSSLCEYIYPSILSRKKNKYMYICTYTYISRVILEEGIYERFNASCFFRHEKLCVFLEALFLYLIPARISARISCSPFFFLLFLYSNPTRLRRSKRNDTTRRKIIFFILVVDKR